MPTQFYSRSHGLQVAWIPKDVSVDLDRIERTRSFQPETTSALGPYNARHHHHRIRSEPLEYLNVRSFEARVTLPKNHCLANSSGFLNRLLALPHTACESKMILKVLPNARKMLHEWNSYAL
jgi:hypothetical protein